MLTLRDHTKQFGLVSKRIMNDVEKISKYLKVYKVFDKIFKGNQFLSHHQGSHYQNPSDVGQWKNWIDAIFLKLFNEDEDGDWYPHYKKINARQDVSRGLHKKNANTTVQLGNASEILQTQSKKITDSQIDDNSLMFLGLLGNNQDKKKSHTSRKWDGLTT